MKVKFLKFCPQETEVGLKREIALLASEKRLEDLYRVTNICLIDIHCLEG